MRIVRGNGMSWGGYIYHARNICSNHNRIQWYFETKVSLEIIDEIDRNCVIPNNDLVRAWRWDATGLELE